jgi:hypothetical protein
MRLPLDPDAPHDVLTVREYIASQALQGLLAHAHGWLKPEVPAEIAVKMADALIVKLNTP